MRAITLGDLLAQADDDAPLTRDDLVRLTERLDERRSRNLCRDDARRISKSLDRYADWLDQNAGNRWPIIRRGPRPPISNVLRLSIYSRDDNHCRIEMGTHSDALELDRLIPWSAGGPDDSDNLRSVCSWHNTARSNFIDHAHAQNLRPTTWWCITCWHPAAEPRRQWRDGTDLNFTPRIEADEEGFELVWCAHCSAYDYSTRYFVGQLGRDLLAAVRSWA